ncbi:MAG TPA: peptidoglycan DD-metalloendopeptidase family protein [Paracoccus sp. (in: a-proteobacteria)]|nr:peptidoglycan DD-metalloendopeptidase family protein [Paracoccus sp. (in: a-proteobacteria)]
MMKAFLARAGACGLILALAACVQPVGQTGAVGAPVAGVAPGGPATSVPGALPRVQMPQMQMPRLALPWGMGRTVAGGTGAQQVRDPFAGQGVRQPVVEPPSGTARAATPAQAATQAAVPAAARTHKVEAGETAWSISRKYGVAIQDLAAANALPASMNVRSGQTLTIPAGGASAASGGRVAVMAPGVGSPTPQPPSAARPLPDEKTVPAAKPAPKTDAPDLGKTRTAASGSGRFAMPVNGSIIRPYKKGANEGIDISAAAGSSVKAASSGTVAAVTRDTDGVPIVVVRHDGGLMTVYAGLGDLSVGKGDSVKAGQTIGTARSSGVVHFEVRKGFDSVDPEDYL